MAETVIRFTLPGLPGLRFIRRPVSIAPGEGTICFVDNGDERMRRTRQCVGVYRKGEWTNGKGRALAFAPTYWIMMDKDDAEHAS